MFSQLTLIAFLGLLCASANAGGSLSDVKSDWGYVDVRTDAHMFWWLFFHDVSYQPAFLPPLDEVPVILWLQGGPGASGTGYGNFEELGPLDLNLNRRETSWTGLGHVLFVDNPVGSGFSYVSNSNAYTTDIDQIAADMVTLLKGFYTAHPELMANPFYIMCESYGGKMAAATSLAISQEMEAGTFNINLQGTGLGDSWISPMDAVNTWGPYLYETGLLDDAGLTAVNNAAAATQSAVDAGNWVRATNLWSLTESVIMQRTDNVDFYNILSPHHATTSRSQQRNVSTLVDPELAAGYSIHVNAYQPDPLDVLMNGEVKTYLGIPASVTWGGQSNDVFSAQSGDFMKPVIDTVDQLVDTGMKVVVYNGQLDLIVDTPGQELWVKRMAWNRLSEFMSQSWKPMYAYHGQDTGGYSKKLDNFEFWWVLKAGHMVPADQGEFMLYLLHDMITA
uniref:retinoid-inducible serine carboxypeptidase n=1 Tax=Ciona intestinalis TaxID=7719 RepID=UPI000052114C|nr:retinoid-inducible serine carboxypeptidase [Ciona intestinalis]|eukprot:XP_002130982.1 retinoid-inducible serine carboxypeptidase [Ciona intestinalis]